MQIVKINGRDTHVMYNLCFNNWENIEKLSNDKVTFKVTSSVDGTMFCEIKTRKKTINLKENGDYLIGVDCFDYPEVYKKEHFKIIGL